MSEETTKHVICEHDQPAASIRGSVPSTETTLLCRNSLVSIGLKHLLEGTCFSITSIASDPGSFSHHYPDATPTLVIVDGSDGGNSVAETVTTLKGLYPQARIAVIADGCDLSSIKLARSAGVDGFCWSAGGREVLIKSLELAMLGEAVLPTHLMTLLLDLVPLSSETEPQNRAGAELERSDARLPKLSTREAEILHCLTEGAPNKIIARKLDVAEATVKVHIKAILRKIGAANRTQAAMWAATNLPANAGPSLKY